jgi:hypothetical protein
MDCWNGSSSSNSSSGTDGGYTRYNLTPSDNKTLGRLSATYVIALSPTRAAVRARLLWWDSFIYTRRAEIFLTTYQT